MSECPSSHDIVSFADAPEELEERWYIEMGEHVKKCPLCRYKVA